MAEAASGVRAAIERDRAELADTVQALVHKTDVRARVREGVSEQTEKVKERPLPFAAVAAVGALLLVAMFTIKARRHGD